jgi:GH25 family lysozyme M1 (1,4-beta-N-acetylmuramidase)
MIRIVDVSEFQGAVDWLRVRRAGIAGGIHKATQYRVDHQHAANHQGIPSVGLPHGCYHFLNWDQPGGQQASFYLATAGHFGPGTFPPILDFERYNGRLPTHQEVDDFLHEVEQVDARRPLLYGNQGDLATLGPLFIGRVAIFLADYGPNNGQPNGDPQAKRRITQFPPSDVKLWQYTSVGTVDGVAGPCDVSLWLDSQADLDAYTLNPQSQVHIQSVAPPVHYQEDNVTKVSVHVPTLDDQGNGNVPIPGVAGRVVAVNLNGNDPNHEGYAGLKPFFSWSDRGSDVLLVIEGGKPHTGFDLNAWVAG